MRLMFPQTVPPQIVGGGELVSAESVGTSDLLSDHLLNDYRISDLVDPPSVSNSLTIYAPSPSDRNMF